MRIWRRTSSGAATQPARFVDAYRNYCWPVESIDDFKLAPFHILASEGRVHVHTEPRMAHADAGRDLRARLCRFCWRRRIVLSMSPDPEQSGRSDIQWWTELTERGGEGMVVKPLDFIAKGKKGLVQPAVKCRGREYLRIIYGPDYTSEANLTRLRNRGLGRKRSLALREFALGVEGTGALRPARTAAPHPRVRLRRPRAGKRTRGSAIVAQACDKTASPQCPDPVCGASLSDG